MGIPLKSMHTTKGQKKTNSVEKRSKRVLDHSDFSLTSKQFLVENNSCQSLKSYRGRQQVNVSAQHWYIRMYKLCRSTKVLCWGFLIPEEIPE